ncbi:MAG: dephospho-CoA kinase [Rhodospirillales bacterium]|jgi:dephospho-CoA kinase|nr:dephospho-CoA kinase [Rhodospirillaceae bacterium]MDP6428333.1 dephospho-CoA kinase [Rhodospirillales bacterium]MDP6642578.1 dephospho-CoA kinase [Rhodospirillales bacterium]MDP6842335.1 dephospho-CoA kinase [Rhodospirillales bacterium]|tara:strand:+ start:284 stop:907 length:624 start_codon:yes stop_codon:yes gene_type:complete
MVIIGLTGSIAMGKSTIAGMFHYLGIPVYDADATVHRLLAKGGEAVGAVTRAFPGSAENGAVSRARLGAEVFGDDAALARLEAILHPIVRREQKRFLKLATGRRDAVAVLDIPLLFESRSDEHCDLIAVVSATPFLQRSRILARPGMTVDKMRAIIAHQMPDHEKRRRADFVINTGLDRYHSLREVRNIVKVARAIKGTHWPPVKLR